MEVKTVNKAISAFVAIALIIGLCPGVASAKTVPTASKSDSTQVSLEITRAATGKVAIKTGSSYKLSAKASSGKVSYKSSAPKVASVSKRGVVKGRSAGRATVTVAAKSGKTKVTKKVRVVVLGSKKYKRVKKLKASLALSSLEEGASSKVRVLFKPRKASNKNVIYKSSAPSVASVSAKGVVTAISPGTAKITVVSCDNKKAKAAVRVNVKAKGQPPSTGSPTDDGGSSSIMPEEHDDLVVQDADAIAPEPVDLQYESMIDYADDAKVIRDSSWKMIDDGLVSFSGGSLPNGISVGDVVVLNPTDENPQGYTIKVESADLASGSISGGRPTIPDVYDRIDVETRGVVTTDGFIPEDDVELVEVESAPEIATSNGNVRVIESRSYPASYGGLAVAGVSGMLTSQADSGPQPSKFKFSWKGLAFTVEPSADIRVDYGITGLKEFYAAVTLKETLDASGKISDVLKGGKVDKKLGSLVFSTPVPGLFAEVALYLNISADGIVKFSMSSTKTGGVKYEGDSFNIVSESKAEPKLEASATIGLGLDITGSVNILAKPIADLSIGGDLKLGMSSNDAKIRSSGMVCNDLKLNFEASVNVGKHDSLLHDLGLSWEKKLASVELKKWHLEDNAVVNKCTWPQNKRTYEKTASILLDDPLLDDSVSSAISAPDVSWVSVKQTLDCYSWKQLKSISNAIASAKDDADGMAIAKKYNLVDSHGKLDGTTKYTELSDGAKAEVRIIGFRHDEKAHGGLAGITFEFANAVALRAMNSMSVSNTGGWSASEVRSYLNGDFMDRIPSSLRSQIEAVNKKTNNVGKTASVDSVSVTADSLWLMSHVELDGKVDLADDAAPHQYVDDIANAEGTQYKLFVDSGVVCVNGLNADRYSSWPILQVRYGNGLCKWWSRSSAADDSGYFMSVGTDGILGYGNASTMNLGIVPCFAL